ncbi:MAG: alpha-amylase family glycosyl hydrolase [Acholeplasmatales bacterium]|jgi:glycosidase|nr:alpha-amylase family glycosyl hydrolase [Acholeplasmataceae bacterium]MDY0115650.1 alpha-amylase family glycosyl hydrolase [Acholeplasmatales bacterium]MCK9289312.1 alpha-amylase family glycosyl hydrolase [Acholeplasmataceae bacterium]MCK9427775.1 alpha-amylase family glycosyl hydrolase [Acholeplasmataceae bacterium]MDD4090153.1 alpha-amylase family glycosyl hydrolase [Acholeplasmataceae bacterium]
MAENTKTSLRNLTIYQVFLRQHLKGTFKSLEKDLNRIRNLGIDIIYLLPVHPIGELQRKGSVGSPYSIKDYLAIDDTFGTMEDFKALIKAAHQLNLKIMIDIVFHHTALDAKLLATNPEWYYYKNGKLSGKVGDWSDITDLDFEKQPLWDYLIEVLLYYAKIGVDGIRADVASLIPIEFWLKARKALLKENPDFIMLAESVHLGFVKEIRDQGFYAASDSETYQAFDILYDYDIHDLFLNYLSDKGNLNRWLEAIVKQESIYSNNYVKLRNLENHDQDRIASYFSADKLLQINALLFFLKGTTMIYAGQEYGVSKKPNLFENDVIDLTPKNEQLTNLIIKLANFKKDSLFSEGNFKIHFQDKEIAVITYQNAHSIALGVFNLGNEKGFITVPFPDGVYDNILYPQKLSITNAQMELTEKPIVLFTIKKEL